MPAEDASVDTGTPGRAGDDATLGAVSEASGDEPASDGEGEAGPDDRGPGDATTCTPDPNWCDTHCGTVLDNCGLERACTPKCGSSGYTCADSGTCVCVPDPAWCAGRCGPSTDNCDNDIDCGPCDGGACQPEPNEQACGARQCGQTTNNCGQKVNCGIFGLSACSLNFLVVCLADGGCCLPQSEQACGTMCGTFTTDNCGSPVQCPSYCGGGRVCDVHNKCCVPTDPCQGACGVSMTDNCGHTVQCSCGFTEECTASKRCCTPSATNPCSANCVDSCGLPSPACCMEAGAPEAGAPEGGLPDASDASAAVGDGSSPDAADGGGDE